MRAREALDLAAMGLLRDIASAHGISWDATTTRSELIERIATDIEDRERIELGLRALPSSQLAALEAARDAGGEIRGFLLTRLLGSADIAAARPLLERGFLFRTFAAVGPHRGEVFTVPDEVLAALGIAGDESAPIDGALPSTVDAPPRETWRASDPVFSLFSLASYLQRERVIEHGSGGREDVFRSETAAWSREPGGWHWQERWVFLQHLAVSTGLIVRTNDSAVQVASRLRTALAVRPSLVERLWRAYLHDRSWSDLQRAHIPHAELLSEQIDAALAREAVLRVLLRLPAGSWMRIDDVLAWLKRAAPTFLREQLDARTAALNDPETGGQLLGEGGWERVEEPYVRYLLLGPLYWLGLLGANDDGSLVTVTRTGSALLQGQPLPVPRLERCTWDDEGLLLAPTRCDLSALFAAERYLKLEGRGQPSTYRLDRQTVARALAGNGTVRECRELLERLTAAPLPPDVDDMLTTWQERAGAYVLRPAVVLEVRSPDDLRRVEEANGSKGFIRARLGPTVAEVPASQAQELADALRGMGELPHLDAALQLMAGRKAYAALVDEHVLEFLLLSLLILGHRAPLLLSKLEGAGTLLERLESVFPGDRLDALRATADSIAATLGPPSPSTSPPTRPRRRTRQR